MVECTPHGRAVRSGGPAETPLHDFGSSRQMQRTLMEDLFKGSNQPRSADKPEGIRSFIHSLTPRPAGGVQVMCTHRGIVTPGTEAVSTPFQEV